MWWGEAPGRSGNSPGESFSGHCLEAKAGEQGGLGWVPWLVIRARLPGWVRETRLPGAGKRGLICLVTNPARGEGRLVC
jgi:hypothetical protein